MTLVEILILAFALMIGLGLIVALFWLLKHFARMALSLLLSLFGILVVIVIYTDAVNGSPLARRVAWVIIWLAQKLYAGVDQSTSGIPQLPNPFE